MTPAAARREERRLWLAIFAPATGWIVAQQLSFYLSGWICTTGRKWVLLAITASALAAAAAGVAAGWECWRRFGTDTSTRDAETARRRFMAFGGLVLSVFFLIAILALAIPQSVHRPCD
jgi:hypothetical protein